MLLAVNLRCSIRQARNGGLALGVLISLIQDIVCLFCSL